MVKSPFLLVKSPRFFHVNHPGGDEPLLSLGLRGDHAERPCERDPGAEDLEGKEIFLKWQLVGVKLVKSP